MFRWLGSLMVLTAVTGALRFGLISTTALGLSGILFGVFAALLALGLVVGILRA